LTEEKITIPNNAIGFISIKAGIKFRGLVNISGFHVDPGFSGKLKFSVYNAGSRDIVLQRKRRLFLLWLSDLDQPTQPYAGEHAYQSEITPEDVMQIAGKIASPGQLKKEIEELKISFDKEIQTLNHRADNIKVVLTVLLTIALGLDASFFKGCVPSSGQLQFQSRRLRNQFRPLMLPTCNHHPQTNRIWQQPENSLFLKALTALVKPPCRGPL
jgi:hypothetical protein